MPTLLIRCQAPLQSWGYQSRFSNRDTGTEPSKSGIIGLLCNALGINRSVPPTAVPLPGLSGTHDLTSLKMGVRVDREGVIGKDYHTAGGGKWKGRAYGVIKANGAPGGTVLSDRFYLMDACFLVGLEGERPVLEVLQNGLKHPVWPLFLGRRSCPPAEPLALPDGISGMALQEALETYHLLCASKAMSVRVVLETEPQKGDVCLDRPVKWPDTLDRIYHPRYVHTCYISIRREAATCT